MPQGLLDASIKILVNAEKHLFKHSVVAVCAFAEGLNRNILFVRDLECEGIYIVPSTRVRT